MFLFVLNKLKFYHFISYANLKFYLERMRFQPNRCKNRSDLGRDLFVIFFVCTFTLHGRHLAIPQETQLEYYFTMTSFSKGTRFYSAEMLIGWKKNRREGNEMKKEERKKSGLQLLYNDHDVMSRWSKGIPHDTLMM